MGLFKKKEPYQPIQGLISEATDYHVYTPSQKQKILWFILGLVASAAVLWLFYENIFVSLIVGIGCGFAFIPLMTKSAIGKRRQKLSLQFRELLDALSTSIGAGKNVQDAFQGAVDDLAIQYTKDSDIVRELEIICAGMYNNIAIEALLVNFAQRSGIEDIENFANVFSTCYRKGGNINEVIKNTAEIIGDKIEIKMELETMVAGQKNEMNIMLVMPVLFIIVMKSMGGGLIDLSTPVGLLSVTGALAIFIAAYFAGQWITNIKL
jgi:tight adherence protein B